jgi:carbamoyltransferase
MIDDEIVGLIQEERFSRQKNQVAFPLAAAKSLISRHLKGDAGRIDQVVFGGMVSVPVYAALDRFSNISVAEHVREQHELWYPHFYEGQPNNGSYWMGKFRAGENLNHGVNYDFSWMGDISSEAAVAYFVDTERPAAVLRHLQCRDDVIIDAIDYHTCHAYYAVYGSPLDDARLKDALVLTADGWGDGCNWSASIIDENGRLEQLDSGAGHVVARLYKWVTLIMGMKPNEHEYKVMGLSGYSNYTSAIEAAEKILFEALDFRGG